MFSASCWWNRALGPMSDSNLKRDLRSHNITLDIFGKQGFAGKQMVKDAAQRVKIRTMID
jgi:hypothetical protein